MAKPSSGRFSGSTAVALAMVVGAGLFAWFGLTGGQMPNPGTPASDRVTIAPSPEAAAEEDTVYASVSTGGLPTRIVVPAAEVDAAIAEVGVVVRDGEPAWETAWHAAGHHIDSALPGQPGNMVISGHVSVANPANLAVFKHLDQVAEGDTIEVYSGHDLYRYTVTNVIVVPPSEVRLLGSKAGSTVTLITCTKNLKDRLVVIGTLQSVVAPGADA